jgi:hypothetical protein
MKIEKVLVAVFCSAIIGDAMCVGVADLDRERFSPAQAKIEAAKKKAELDRKIVVAQQELPDIISNEVKNFKRSDLKHGVSFVRNENNLLQTQTETDLLITRCNKIIMSRPATNDEAREYLGKAVAALDALSFMGQIDGDTPPLQMMNDRIKRYIAEKGLEKRQVINYPRPN